MVSPVGGAPPKEASTSEEPVRLTAADFEIEVTASRPGVCPAGHQAVAEYGDEDAPERVEIHFARPVCESCPLRPRCPVRWHRRPELAGGRSLGAYVLNADLVRVNIERRRRAEAKVEWRKRYAVRAGIEGTNPGVETTSRAWTPPGAWRPEGSTRCVSQSAGVQHQADDSCPSSGEGAAGSRSVGAPAAG